MELHYVQSGEPVRWPYIVTVLVEACSRGCNILELGVTTGDAFDSNGMNAVVDWLVYICPKEFHLPKNVYGEATFK